VIEPQRQPLMNLLHLAIYCFVTSALLSACSSKPYIDYDTDYNFGRATSYFIITTTGNENENEPLMASRVQAAIDSELKTLGLSPAISRQQADLAVSYSLTSEDRPNNNRVSVGMGTGSYGRSSGISVGGSVSRPVGGDTRRYIVIQIDMHPGSQERLIWRSRDALELRGDPARRAEDAQRMVRRLLAGFPP
jgi:hypothetical protein